MKLNDRVIPTQETERSLKYGLIPSLLVNVKMLMTT